MLSNFITPKYLEKKTISQLKKEFLENSPYKHIELKNFLKPDITKIVGKSLEKEKYNLIDEDRGKFYRTKDFHGNKNFVLYSFRSFLISKEFNEYLESITKEKIKPNSIDVHSLKMDNTHYMLCHTDKELNRKLAFIFYFTDCNQDEGGELILYNKELNEEKRYLPKSGTLIIIKIGEDSYHAISEVLIKKPRITIGGWYE